MARVITFKRYSRAIRASAEDQYGYNILLKYCQQHLYLTATTVVNGQIVEDIPASEHFYIEVPLEFTIVIELTHEDQLKAAAIREGFTVNIETVANRPGVKVDFPNHTLKLMEPEGSKYAWQNNGVIAVCENDHTVFELQTGKGKCLRNDTRVRIPGGWRKIGDMAVGDTVIGGDGKPTNVTGVYPNGVVDLYNVTFDDGRIIPACGEHLWQSFYINTSESNRWKVRNTLEMKRLIEMPNPRVYIPLPLPEDTPSQDFPIHPYLLGVLLGDGYLGKKGVAIFKKDRELIERVKGVLPNGTKLSGGEDGLTWRVIGTKYGFNPLFSKLEKIGLREARSNTKFIPKEYFEGSIEQRLDLVRGLLDTDGTVGRTTGMISYTTVSEWLAYGMQELIWSLGGIAKISKRYPNYTYRDVKRKGQLAYTVTIRISEPSRLFYLSRKKVRTKDDGQYCNKLKLRVKSIEPIDSAEATCISVDNADSLYIADGWVVTHNTIAANKAVVVYAKLPAFITKPAYMPMWENAIQSNLGLVVDKDLAIINKLDRLVKLLQNGRDPNVRAYLISSYTIDAYIEEWAAAPSEYKDPFDIMPILGIGICIFDEAHEVFRKQYLSYIAMSPIVLLDLSATLLPDTAFLKKRYLERFPIDNRFQLEYSAFIDVVGLAYTMKDHKVAQRINKQSMYNHHVFESKVLKRTVSANKYFDMLYQVAKKWYLDKYQPGQKMLITLSTRQMCEEVTAYFKARCPEHSVVRYIDGDSYKEACAGDIIISTMGKSGTGVDYVGLILNIIAVSVKASQKSLQMLGRTRDACIERWGIRPVVVYPICMTIPKQVVYYNLKRKLLAGRVNSMVTLNTGICI